MNEIDEERRDFFGCFARKGKCNVVAKCTLGYRLQQKTAQGEREHLEMRDFLVEKNCKMTVGVSPRCVMQIQ